MTREECIEILDKYAHHSCSEAVVYPRKVATEAFEMAIKALEQEPCEDAVSRADTLQSFESYCEKNCQYSKKQRDVMCGACMMGDAIEIVEDLPSVTPKQRTGKWIDRWDKIFLCENKDCSICGHMARTRYNFCPNCGAKMEGESE